MQHGRELPSGLEVEGGYVLGVRRGHALQRRASHRTRQHCVSLTATLRAEFAFIFNSAGLQLIARHPLHRAHTGGFPGHAAAVEVQSSWITTPEALPGYEQRVDPEGPADDRAVAPRLDTHGSISPYCEPNSVEIRGHRHRIAQAASSWQHRYALRAYQITVAARVLDGIADLCVCKLRRLQTPA